MLAASFKVNDFLFFTAAAVVRPLQCSILRDVSESPEIRRERVAVRVLVRSVVRSGDLAAEPWEAVPPWEALRIHQRVQKSRPAGYRSEVVVKGEVRRDDYHLLVEGRLDGLLEEAGRLVVEEIKTTRRSFDDLPPGGEPLHWAQALVYSHLVQREYGATAMVARLTYVNADTQEERSFTRELSREELVAAYEDLVGSFADERQALWRRRAERNSLARSVPFPLGEFRPGQYAMAAEVYRALRDGTPLLLQAPTGIGKTLGVLFPAVKAMGENHVDRLLFLTARTPAQSVAFEAASALSKAGLRWNVLQLTAREKLCFNPELECLARDCPYARGYYDRLEGALCELREVALINREHLEAIARRHTLCPFSLALDFGRSADLVIGDYNYAFDPGLAVKEALLFPQERVAVLVDEAHNAVERARENFSAVLGTEALQESLDVIKSFPQGTVGPTTRRRLRRVLRKALVWFAQQEEVHFVGGNDGEVELPQLPVELMGLLQACRRALGQTAGAMREQPEERRAVLRKLTEAVDQTLWVGGRFSSDFAVILERSPDGLSFRLRCLDPARLFREQIAFATASVFFSATLSPGSYFRGALGLPPDSRFLTLPNPFSPEHLCVVMLDGVSTLYQARRRSSTQLADALSAFLGSRKGNYLIYFPSYAYLRMVLPKLGSCGGARFLVQQPIMSEEERDRFLAAFRRNPRRTVVGLAVSGGVFGEAIDLVGDRLSGVAVVGVGLPAPSLERDVMRRYYEAKYGKGFEYAYVYPGITRVLQAAGRVIRSEEDRGAVLLIDPRFPRHPYRELLPRDWNLRRVGDVDELRGVLHEFWEGNRRRALRRA
jgi:DNA excision repair protein ERCC-2